MLRLPRTMTVADLIDALQGMNPEAPVLLAYNYGDYHRTVAAAPVRGVALLPIVESGYSHDGIAVGPEDQPSEEGVPEAVVIHFEDC